ncbi:unnamed protein product [Ixodes hexagonus]
MVVSNFDHSGVLKGSCIDCRCPGYQRTVAMVQLSPRIPIGACVYCWRPPGVHKDAAGGTVTDGGPISESSGTTTFDAEGTALHGGISVKSEPVSPGADTPQQEAINHEAAPSPPNATCPKSQQEPASGTVGDSRMSGMWSTDNVLPPFSGVVNPLLYGQRMGADEHKRMARQLRHELIRFLNDNNLIEDANPAIRRWKYQRLGESLLKAYPKISWDKPRGATGCPAKSPMATFLSRLAETRRHRKAHENK